MTPRDLQTLNLAIKRLDELVLQRPQDVADSKLVRDAKLTIKRLRREWVRATLDAPNLLKPQIPS